MFPLKPKPIFNQESKEEYQNCTILNGNPNGIINFNKSPHKAAYGMYKTVCSRQWFPSQVNTSKDLQNYVKLTPEEKRAFDLVLAQLITNDSIQTNQLMDGINKYITSPVVNALLAGQAFQEVVHSESYSVMAEDIAQDTDRIFAMQHNDTELYNKNKAVEDMYIQLYKPDRHPTNEDILMVFVANQILEELIFPGGFSVIFSLENKLPGCAEMVKEISIDELLHVEIFKYIFRTAIKESFNNSIPEDVVLRSAVLIQHMVDAEIRWLEYVTTGLLGYSKRSIEIFVQSKGNSICNNLGLPILYSLDPKIPNPIQSIIDQRIKSNKYESRTNFFEANPTEYTKHSLEIDY